MNKDALIREFKFKALRSSGAGGQHVNKVSSKVELSFAVDSSLGLSTSEKELILSKLRNRLSQENVLIVQCDNSRSQHKNKVLVIKRSLQLIEDALKVPKKRKKTKPGRAAVEKRLKSKRKITDKKNSRQKPDLE